MSQVLMPKATAVWLVENSTLTFDQISAFTGLHPLEVQAIADGEVAGGMTGLDPTTNGQLTKEEIARCEADPSAKLAMVKAGIPLPAARGKGATCLSGAAARGARAVVRAARAHCPSRARRFSRNQWSPGAGTGHA